MKAFHGLYFNQSQVDVIFENKNLELLFIDFKKKFKHLLDIFEYTRHENDNHRDKYPLQHEAFYLFRKVKHFEEKGDKLKNIINLEKPLPWKTKEVENFNGNWKDFFENEFQPFVKIVLESFNKFTIELDNQTVFSENIESVAKEIHLSDNNSIIISGVLIELSSAQFELMEVIINVKNQMKWFYSDLRGRIEHDNTDSNSTYKGKFEAIRTKMKSEQINDFFLKIGQNKIEINSEYLA